MSIRVHDLAKELRRSNKDVMNFLIEKEIEVKSHMSTMTRHTNVGPVLVQVF